MCQTKVNICFMQPKAFRDEKRTETEAFGEVSQKVPAEGSQSEGN